ncbi:MAG: hypothetical protein J6T82_00160 [Bacteroidaceae bacterium]|nr:hypothetical protein [Bacteroidaceae bacterium]
MRALSIGKLNENLINEDAAIAKDSLIAVSDGAGGGGVFADLWSRYLVEHLPEESITNYEQFDKWIDGIWEPFYNDCEEKAKAEGGMLLNKFYDEGSFATLVAVWKGGQWVSYGDSVAFCYDKSTGRLSHSFGRIADFNNPPYLVNCKDPTVKDGFKAGRFDVNEHCIVFAASDALAHYILMMYEVAHVEEFTDELMEAVNAKTKDSNFILAALNLKNVDFEKDVIDKLVRNKNNWNVKQHLQRLRNKRLLAHDDYSLVVL